MIKNILNTVFVRAFGAITTLLIVVINSNQLGAGGIGEISLVVLAISIFILMNGIASGAMVYFIPRENIFKLLSISYIWTFITVFLFILLLVFVKIAPREYYFDIIALSVILSISNTHEKILLGKERIININIIEAVKIISLLFSLLILYYYFNKSTVFSYIISLYISYSIGLFFAFIFSLKYINITNTRGLFPLFKKVFKLSGYNAFAAITQKLNYRLSYYFIEYFLGINALGIFAVGVQITESTLIIGRSISFVQYSKISNLRNSEKAIKLTVLLVKLILIISSVSMIILSFIPSSVYSLIFSNEFTDLNLIITSLSLGIIALSCTMIISPYFSGTGNQKLNARSAFAGLIVTIIAGIILIPKYNILGAGYTTSLSYLISMIYQFYLFKKQSNTKISAFIIKKQDLKFGFETLRTLFKTK